MRGRLFRQLVENNKEPLSIFGTINAYSSVLAKKNGVKSIYLSGSGVAAASFGLPDLGFTKLKDVVEDARRITSACDLPLLVDVDTGFGSLNSIQNTVKLLEKENVAAIHIEDQVELKRCGHRPNKKLVSVIEMQDRIKAAVDARTDDDFVIMARSDALAVENEDMLLERINSYIEAGADMIFPEAMESKAEFEAFKKAVDANLLVNMTEFGKSELLTRKELENLGISIVIYPVTTQRLAMFGVEKGLKTIKETGSANAVLDIMQTRSRLYEILNYSGYNNYDKSLYNFKLKKGQ